MQLPMRVDEIVSRNAFFGSATSAASLPIGRARSGECGPTIYGSRVDKSSFTTRS